MFIVAAAAAAAFVVVMGQYVYVVLFKILISIRFYYGPKIKLAPSDFVRFGSGAGCAHHSNGQLSLCDAGASNLSSVCVLWIAPSRRKRFHLNIK